MPNTPNGSFEGECCCSLYLDIQPLPRLPALVGWVLGSV